MVHTPVHNILITVILNASVCVCVSRESDCGQLPGPLSDTHYLWAAGSVRDTYVPVTAWRDLSAAE